MERHGDIVTFGADGAGAFTYGHASDGSPVATGWREPDEAVASRLLDFLANIRPAWHTRAACRGCDPDIWFPWTGNQATTQIALETCGRCPVQTECREAGANETCGIWGGETQSDRGHRRGRPQPTGEGRSVRHRPSLPVEQVGTWCHHFYRIAGHGTVRQHRTRNEPACEPCRTFDNHRQRG